MSDNTPGFHVPVEQVIAGAVKAKLKRVLIIGETENGKFYAAGSERTEDHSADIESFQERLESGEWDAPEEEEAA